MRNFSRSNINHNVRLTLLDAENKLIIEDTVIPREFFPKDFIKSFLETSLENLELKTIIY